jgi:ubiquinone/menaquinone biosynthesis C-methylase UbiE
MARIGEGEVLVSRKNRIALAIAAVTAVGVASTALRKHRSGQTPTPATRGWATCSASSARTYDLLFGWLLGGLYRRLADDLEGALGAVDMPEVLEIGPGPGRLAVELAGRHPGLRLTGLDIDPAMVARAAARAEWAGVADRVLFVEGDVAALAFPDASFDLVTSSLSVHHWPDATAGFAEIRRVLRPDGRAIIYDLPDRWGRLETMAPPLAATAAAAGLEGSVAPFPWPGRLRLVRRLEAVPGGDSMPA